MTTYDYEHVSNPETGSQTLTLVGSDGSVITTNPDAHPYFDELLEAAVNSDHGTVERLSDYGRPIVDELTQLSERVAFHGDTVYFDGEAMDNALSRHLLRMAKDGFNYHPVVAFMERLADNPSTVSRVALWTWLNANDFTLNHDGKIVGYKGVSDDLRSIHSGAEDVSVNGVVHRGKIPNRIGATISMSRDLIDESRDVSCSIGLHVGTFSYARGWGHGVTLTVLVNPEHVVAVPSDSSGQKMRVCEYQVVNAESTEIAKPVTELHATPVDDEVGDGGLADDFDKDELAW